ncbi:MAG: hypothetical protein A2252_09825 [Elusimicrobia bacterium RIFOXYA2_FULL_39_19]|nr:MAG: hypothetical protein A2252_09825 [Elusimicrobia bacterium RIFOXYA2_FULL_39_19]
MPNVIEASDSSFENEVLKSDKLTVVYFKTQWCPVCKSLSPVIDILANKYAEKIKFVSLDPRVAQITAVTYGIMSVPAILFFKNGVETLRNMGAVSEKNLTNLIDKVLAG